MFHSYSIFLLQNSIPDENLQWDCGSSEAQGNNFHYYRVHHGKRTFMKWISRR